MIPAGLPQAERPVTKVMGTNINDEKTKKPLSVIMRLLENPSLSSLGFTKAPETDEDQPPTREASATAYSSERLITVEDQPRLPTKEPEQVHDRCLPLNGWQQIPLTSQAQNPD
jgi:hypothetical protein